MKKIHCGFNGYFDFINCKLMSDQIEDYQQNQ